jgi:hypothetical protein
MRSVGGVGEYNALCDVCKFRYKNHELRQRWDGLMVCKYDWEARHPMDFFRARNDVTLLPFIRSDTNDKNLTWTPVFTNLTVTLNANETELINDGIYILNSFTVDGATPKTSGTATVDFLTPNFNLPKQDALSTTSSNGTTTTMTLPTTTGGTGTCRVMTREAKFLGSANISASAATVVLPAWTGTRGGLVISFTYGT